MRFIFVRHGETAWNREFRLQGTSDVPLNSLGARQAEAVAACFPQRPDILFVSPLARAAGFAAPLAARFSLAPVVLPELREMSFGRWEGLRYEDMDGEAQKQFELWYADPVNTCPPGGEAVAVLRARIQSAVEKMAAGTGEGQTAAVFTHGGVVRVAVTMLMGLPPKTAGRLQIDPGSLTVLDFLGGCWRLVRLNDTCHLRDCED